jgi:amino acid adenylation domain-containing protein
MSQARLSAGELSRLSPAQRRDLLRDLLARPDTAPRIAPMSFAQQRLWFLDQLTPGNAFYNIDSAIRLRGQLNLAALERSLREICRRHGTLRTTFGTAGGLPVQIVHSHSDFHLVRVDLCGQSEPVRLAFELIRREGRLPFDLVRGPVFRGSLIALGEHDHVLALTMHHIVSDGWSMGILISELAGLYDAFSRGMPSRLAPLPLQYADYAQWQRNLLQGEVLQQQIDYWKQQLCATPNLELPTDYSRPTVPTFCGGRHYFEIPGSTGRELRQLARDEGATPFMVLLAAFQSLLNRYTGQDDIVVGTPIAGRDRAELEPLIGFFVNTLVLRARVARDETFRALLHRTRELTLDAFAHHDLPFERLVEELQPKRDVSRNPLCQVVFALQNTPTSRLELPGLEVSYPSVSNETTRFDLVLDVWENDAIDSLQACLEYSSDLFTDQTIQEMGEHFVRLLEAIAAGPDQLIGRLALLSLAERRRLLVEWNDTSVEYPDAECAHKQVEACAAAAPDRLAVDDGNTRLTYGELDRRANQLAHFLVSQGSSPGDLVGVCMEPSCDWVVALLAVWKAGFAYVALDPTYPPNRLGRMLSDSKAEIVLTRSTLVPQVGCATFRPICLDAERGSVGRMPATSPNVPCGLRQLAYVIYTSGSTGEPNGVLLEHLGLLNLIRWHQGFYHVNRDDRASQVAGPGFDASVWELWPYLTAGASVHIVDADIRLDPRRLLTWMVEHGITLAFLPTPLAEAVLAEPMPARLALRAVLTGGDRLRAPPREGLGFDVVNHYGPTECTVVTTVAVIPPGDSMLRRGDGSPPIGRPIANTRVYVLDSSGQLAPARVPGELAVAGLGLARGYHGRPELDARKFVPDLWSPAGAALAGTPGVGERGRMYLTGDRVRWRHDGQLEFLGRMDTQVSVRGFRVELAEIEFALAQHPAIRSAVVTAQIDTAGDARLAAYLLRNDADQAEAESAAQQHLTHWKDLYDETYAQGEPVAAEFDITGWRSSYTGLPIPEVEMREWVDETVADIEQRNPQRILEIGCGTGLILHRLAPAARAYVGIDFSRAALCKLAERVQAAGLTQVRLLEGRADEVTGLAPSSFDVVILNSVIQYFPSADYLLGVLDRAVRWLVPGGSIFVGDVRSLPLHRLFCASVELHRVPADLTVSQFLSRVQASMAREEELLVSPRFFWRLPELNQRATGVSVELKRGEYQNELTRFRYNVWLQTGELSDHRFSPSQISTLDWSGDGLSLEGLKIRLHETSADLLIIRNIPNIRLQRENLILKLAQSLSPMTTVGELRQRLLVEESANTAEDPQRIRALARSAGYRARVMWADGHEDGRLDVWLCRELEETLQNRQGMPIARPGSIPIEGTSRASATGNDTVRGTVSFETLRGELLACTNEPLQAKTAQRLIPKIRRFLRDRLPEHMVPSAFVFLKEFPITPNGKVDRRRLPEPLFMRDGKEGDYCAPRSAVEEVIAGLWIELLGVEQVSIRDNFFDLGGHSLLGTQFIARLRDLLGVATPIRRLFESPTIEGLAAVLLEDSSLRDSIEQTAKWVLEVSRMSEAEIAAQLQKGEA